MQYDMIEFLMFCNSVQIQGEGGYSYCSCRFEWLCMTRLLTDWSVMIYSEGE